MFVLDLQRKLRILHRNGKKQATKWNRNSLDKHPSETSSLDQVSCNQTKQKHIYAFT